MKKKLDDLYMSEFIELSCGNVDVLLEGDEKIEPEKLVMVMRSIIMEYKEIADTTGVSRYLSEGEGLTKARMRLILYIICDNLLELKRIDKVREVLKLCGLDVENMTDSRIAAEVASRQERAKKDIEKIEEERSKIKVGDVDVRKEFNSQIATLMAHFKFQIDIEKIKAPIYANLVAQFNREVKAQLAALKKR